MSFKQFVRDVVVEARRDGLAEWAEYVADKVLPGKNGQNGHGKVR